MQFFVYGSLMDRELLELRATDGLRMEAATLHDFDCRRVCGESFPVLVPRTGGRVEGVLVSDLTAADIARLQFYEASDYEGSDYALTTLAVECRGERVAAQVFMPTFRLPVDETTWDFATWAVAERDLFVVLVEERMSRYGRLTAAENNALWPEMKARIFARFGR
jgi:hypothetical protein